jgi:peroxiredoxin Q/BCP
VSTQKGKKSPSPRKRNGRKIRRKNRSLGVGIGVAIIIGAAIIALGVIFFLNNPGPGSSSTGTNQAGKYAFQVGNPGPGAQAPAIRLPSTDGNIFDLASMRGKTVLLYFQEGLTCQPCWDQLKDIQSNINDFHALKIDRIVSITTDPLDALKQKVADEGLSIPVLSDPGLAVSQAYSANSYGMMGASRDGHTFIVVGPDGRIKWRADYGGSPNYTMDVPVPNLIADIRRGLSGSSS